MADSKVAHSATSVLRILLLLILFCVVTFSLLLRILPSGLAKTEASSFELTVTAGAVNVRAGPNVQYRKLLFLEQGQRAPVVSEDPETGWLLIYLEDGRTGWVSGSKSFVSVSLASSDADYVQSNGYSRFLLNFAPALALSLFLSFILGAVVFFFMRRWIVAAASVVMMIGALLFYGGVSDYFVGFRINRYVNDTYEHVEVFKQHSVRELNRRYGMIQDARHLRSRLLHKPIELFIEREAWPVTILTFPLFSEPLDDAKIKVIQKALAPEAAFVQP